MNGKKILNIQIAVIILTVLLKLIFVFGFSSCGLVEKVRVFNSDDESRKLHTFDQGYSNDTAKYYYPVTITSSENSFTSCDTSMLSVFSGCLLYASEPLLYSVYNPEHNFYRLMVFKPNGPVKIFTLYWHRKMIRAYFKELSRPAFLKPQISGRYVSKLRIPGELPDTSLRIEEFEHIKELAYNELKITKSFNKIFDGIEIWEKMGFEIEQAEFFDLPAYKDNSGKDHYILEAKIGNKYWLVDRSNPVGKFKKCCDYMMKFENITTLDFKDGFDD